MRPAITEASPGALAAPLFTDWQGKHAELWANQAVRLQHRAHLLDLFSRDSLAELIDRYPRQHYALVHMGAQGDRRLWREGDLAGMPGHKVIEAIANGRMWLNLRRVSEVDRRFGALLDQIFAEVERRVPGYATFSRTSGILISSPMAQVYYHSDLPGQSLWQIEGRKRVYVYPPKEPFLSGAQLENIALYGIEVDLAYEPWYDEHAEMFEIGPGEMLHWPLNAPHRVENLDCLNISMTTEYWTEAIRRRQMVNLANGIMRNSLRLAPRSRTIAGPTFWAKAMLQAGVKRAGLLEKPRKARRPIDFRLDPEHPGAIVDLATAAE
ncbi:MAG TPA: hypothetical protein PK264_23005 [Hyphomicrobiaceae bacterium]|nr:hypothetical protein [Hyphomicrobiaceae bacterium]